MQKTNGYVVNSRQQSRLVSEHGETLVVRVINGVSALVDPCDEYTAVHVPSGRHARLVNYNFNGLLHTCGRDALTVIFHVSCCLGFAKVGHPNLRVLLWDLPEGQVVDVLPATEPAVIYATLRHPLPVLYEAVAVEPVYALAA